MKALQFSVDTPKYIGAKVLGAFLGRGVFTWGPAKTVSLVDLPEPLMPGEDWVKIKTVYCGFCGSDLNLIHLHDSPTASPFTSFPCILGHEIAGEIVEAGKKVERFKPGDSVVVNPALGCEPRGISPSCTSCRNGRPANCENLARGKLPPGMFTGINAGINGGFAPFLVAHESQLFHKPREMSWESAVMTEPLGVALQTLFDNMPRGGEKILVIGGGVIGHLIMQAAHTLTPDCLISLMEPSGFAAGFAQRIGSVNLIPVDDPFAHTARVTGASIYKPMIGREITMGGYARIYDTVGSASTLNLSMRLLAARGTLSIVGIGGPVKLDLTPLWLKLQTVKGVYGSGRIDHNGSERHVFELALELMQRNRVNAEMLVTHRFRLEDYRRMIAVNRCKNRHNAMKTVVSFV